MTRAREGGAAVHHAPLSASRRRPEGESQNLQALCCVKVRGVRRIPVRRGAAAFATALLALSCRREAPEKPMTRARPGPAEPVDQDAVSRKARAPGGRTPVIWVGLDG